MDKDRLLTELQFKGIRSSGPGGQSVNKVASKIELAFNISESKALGEREKNRILKKLGNRISREYVLTLQCDTARSQHKNKELVVQRLVALLEEALIVPKKRKKTKPGRKAVEKRLKAKKISAEKKTLRQKPDMP